MRMVTNILTEDRQQLSGVYRFRITIAPLKAAGPGRDKLRDTELQRAAQFTWEATVASTLDVYREAAERRENRRK